MKPKISLVTLGVSDIGRALAFYRDGLGFPVHNYKPGEDFAMLALEGSWLALYPWKDLAEEVGIPVEKLAPGGITLAHNVSSKTEVDRVFALAITAGGAPHKPPQDVFWGGYSGYFADPDGHLWEVAWNPFTDLT